MDRVLFGKKIVPHHLLNYAEQLYDILVGEIERGRWKVNERLPGVINLAKELRFGTKTVQTAYDRLKAEGYVRTLGYRGTYLQSLHPLASEALGRIGVLVPADQAADPLLLWYQHVLLAGARRRRLVLEIVVVPEGRMPSTPDDLEQLLGGRFRGLVSLAPFPGRWDTEGLSRIVPVVFLCPPYEHCAPRVSADVSEAARELTSLAIRSGHRRVLLSADSIEPDPRLTALHIEGYLEAMEDHGLPVDHRIIEDSRRVSNQDAESVTAHLRRLADGEDTAVLAGSLGRAMALVRLASSAGLSIPGDFGVASIGSAPVDGDGGRLITGMLPDFDFMVDTCLDIIARQCTAGRSDVSAVSVRMHLVPGHTLRGVEARASSRSAVLPLAASG